jgi:predicted N-acetyltransferase YhbS
MEIRSECAEDVDAIRIVTSAAFKNAPHSSRTEAAIVDALRPDLDSDWDRLSQRHQCEGVCCLS